MQKLTTANFNLDDDPPTVTAKAVNVKRRKQHTHALRPDMAAELWKHLASKTPRRAGPPDAGQVHLCEDVPV